MSWHSGSWNFAFATVFIPVHYFSTMLLCYDWFNAKRGSLKPTLICQIEISGPFLLGRMIFFLPVYHCIGTSTQPLNFANNEAQSGEEICQQSGRMEGWRKTEGEGTNLNAPRQIASNSWSCRWKRVGDHGACAGRKREEKHVALETISNRDAQSRR